MQKISFGGKEYIKASAVAKQFRYTSDYVGQLCRTKKVVARRVGRQWYVDLDSVKAYRKTKHQTQKQTIRAAATSAPAGKKSSTPARVEPVLRTKTLRVGSRRARKRTATPVQYSSDASAAVPILNASEPLAAPAPATPPVVTVEATPSVSVAVSSKKRTHTKFSSEKLPEISLSGKLSVSDATAEVPPVEPIDTDADDAATVAPDADAPKTDPEAADSTAETAPAAAVDTAEPKQPNKKRAKQPKTAPKAPTTAPDAAVTPILATDPDVVVPAQPVPATATTSLLQSPRVLLLTGLVAVLCAGGVLSLGSEVTILAGEYRQQLQFDVANVSLVSTLFE